MSYSEQLETYTHSNELYDRDERVEEIQHDIQEALSDGTLMGELLGEAMGAILKEGLEKVEAITARQAQKTMSAIKEMSTDTISRLDNADTSLEIFSKRLANELTDKELSRDRDLSRDDKALDMDK